MTVGTSNYIASLHARIEQLEKEVYDLRQQIFGTEEEQDDFDLTLTYEDYDALMFGTKEE